MPNITPYRKKRGAPPGNRNRLKHGRYSKAAIIAQAARADELSAMQFADALVNLVKGIGYVPALVKAKLDEIAVLPVSTLPPPRRPPRPRMRSI